MLYLRSIFRNNNFDFIINDQCLIYFNATKMNNFDTNQVDLKSFKNKRSLFSIKDIGKNEKINRSNIISLRPKIGVGSQNYFKIIGKRVKRNISKDDPIFFKDLK